VQDSPGIVSIDIRKRLKSLIKDQQDLNSGTHDPAIENALSQIQTHLEAVGKYHDGSKKVENAKRHLNGLNQMRTRPLES
jgi:hypothetical protein